MSTHNARPSEHPEIAYSNARSYVTGYVVTVILLGIALLLVQYHVMSAFNLMASISIIAFLTTAAKLVFLFHLDFSEAQRWNTLTLMLNVPLLILSIGLTAWMFQTLYDRVMMH